MNLSEEKKHPLRSMPIQQKKTMLENFFESRGSSGVDFYSFTFLLDLDYLSTPID